MWITERAAREEQAGNVAPPGGSSWVHPNATQTQLRNFVLEEAVKQVKSKRKPNAHNRAYARAFKRCKAKHQKKNGGWKKGGFKRCVKEAHKLAKKSRR